MEFPAALLKRALGMYVDPLEMSLSEVQSAVIAPIEAGFTTRTLEGPELSSPSQEPPEDDAETAGEKRPRHRRRRVLVPALVALVGVAATGGWWVAQGRPALNAGLLPWPSSASTGPSSSSTPNTQSNTQPSTPPSTQPSTQVTATQVSTSQAPVVTHAKPSETPSGKPNVTLASALAFKFNSATLSPQAKTAIGHLAQEVRSHGLTGKIYVDGYTDDLGSASHGLVLSQQRADAVSHYLGSRLVGVPVTIVSTGHGEAHPVADNKTAAGRRANRRVAITLPTS
jgi:outer membrane protein OmpA-like peptidoglycan-associated protein